MPFVEDPPVGRQSPSRTPSAFVFSPPLALDLPQAVGLQATANGLVVTKKGRRP